MSWQRCLYGALWRTLTPLIRRYLRKRAKQAPAYLLHWDERFGRVLQPRAVGAIWIHAVSVGETRAAQPLVAALRRLWPDAPLLLTQMTPTGRATAEALYPDAEVRYLPYDYPQAAADFLAAYRPRCGVLMETELWPNLIHAAAAQRVPLVLANARLSDKSLKGYRRILGLIRPAMRDLAAVAAQTAADADRFRKIGAENITVCGNSKYDIEIPAEQMQLADGFRQRIGARQALLCASTREGEEALILDAWLAAGDAVGDALLVLAPRHPERLQAVAELAAERGLKLQRRSDGAAVAEDTQVWLGDSMGEMFGYLGACDVAFIGGSLLPFGCHNLIEPAIAGVPALFGPSVFNFQQAAADAQAAGAARQVADAAEMVALALSLLADPERRAAMREGAAAFRQAHRGASQRMLEVIRATLDAS
ncbi:lipid IV(A) 3-deoxy-D-manno-octulosonic acid transferase [Chromobacterium subtsugae]|uniref:3-deoxy-D-manno-octulosonic acid transferase n=1 Tax=Chromobacterium subtsugae TaxID=251747 RepID=A0ABS7F7I4_9NEIS|nr:MULTISPECIES: lipid IV(A) 3-deoxy-D-manno-octulosonic acid transferase [Chromobacterium]KZE86143.1 3-deoxy-D-manno-octulosonic acid transferase [Chromobacterium sp. F49]MBW7568846.1 lipid IV(A) 3-deoxy-D-manno-octulosonic acid transferase [Chromobacterium subtsugae]MBW8286047.1 lipid IV(A) 3-deoxy-D-manno-octulosonic acid transferase [Chromobacterium subtsugae]WSE91897.1 lipid IV(A) 3-deoxy-D-manno-octulosonic acid transferase [Chromobacterium subtsugae]WVH60271.1 lipid IV(A) 3-deoxy-D-mann